jgi:hypothetical protein
MILGLDISTSITGFTILDNSGNPVLIEAIDLRSKKYKSFFDKASAVKRRLVHLKSVYNIEKIFIEQSLQAFRPGLSSAQVILTLGKFNGIVSWICFELFGLEPNYIGASTARKALGIKVERGQNAKEVVLKHIETLNIGFQYEKTSKNNPVAGTFDKADSYVIAKAGFLSIFKTNNS